MSNSEFKISSSSNITKKYPVVTSLLDGGFVVIWEGNENESNFGVYGQRYTAEGKELGTEFQVSSDRTSYQIVPSVAPLNDGGFVVTWYSYSVDLDTYEVYGQRFGAATNKTGSEFLIESEQKINPDADPGDEGPSITSFQDGGFLVTWQTYGPDGEDFTVSGRRYDSLGQAEDLFVINPNTVSAQSNPVVTALEDGGFVVSWEATGQDGDGRGIFGQLYDSFGNPNGAEFAVNTRTADDQHSPSVASLKNNDFIITWTSEGQDATDWGGIYGQRFDGTGSPSGSEFLINTHVDNSQSAPSVTSLNDNGFVVTWESWGQDGSYYGIYGQRYSSDNTALGEEFQVNTQSSGDQRDSSVSNLHDGGFLVTWESNGQDDEFSANESGIYGQRFNSLGGKVAVNATIINGTENDDFLYGDSDNNIINGLNGDDWLYGELGDDTLDGGEGFDRIDFRGSTSSVLVDFSTGTATGEAIGTDLIFNVERVIGSDFDDLLTGSNTTEAWESYTGGLGDDTINGAGGKDAVWYGRSSSAIYVDLLSETATGGEGTDKLVSIEHVIGSNFADTLIGSEGNDTFSPDALGDDGAGANFKIGGADSINGRGGIDSVSYNNTKSEDGFTPSGILANLSLGTVVDPAGNTDNISNVENVSGSPYDDSITGDNNTNVLRGNAGKDTLDGGAGDDTLDGGSGFDTAIYYGAQSDFDVVIDGSEIYVTEIATDEVDTLTGIEQLEFDDEGSIEHLTFYQQIIGHEGDEFLIGSNDSDQIFTGGGDDYVSTLGGDDQIYVEGTGDVTLVTGTGSDEVIIDEDVSGSVRIITDALDGESNTLVLDGNTATHDNSDDYSSFGYVRSADGTKATMVLEGASSTLSDGITVEVENQLEFDAGLGKWVVSGKGFQTIISEDDENGYVSFVIGSDFSEGDALFSTGEGDVYEVMLGGEGADVFTLLGGSDQAEVTVILGDNYDLNADEGLGNTNSSSGDTVHFAWNKDDVDIRALEDSNFAYEITHKDTDQVVELYDIEHLYFADTVDSIMIGQSPLMGSNDWQGAANGQEVDFENDNVSFKIDGDTITVCADCTVTEMVTETVEVVTGTGRRAKTTYEERTTEQSTIHEDTVIWQGSRKDISGFEFSDQTVKVVNMETADFLTGEKPTYVFTDDAEIIFGTNESDVIDAGGGDDLIIGGGGDDDITGGDGSDILLGGEGNDILRDKYDDDVDLAGMISDDIMIGGAGVDTIDTGGGNDIVATGILDLDGDDQFTNADVDIMAQIQPDNDLINQLYNLTEDENAY